MCSAWGGAVGVGGVHPGAACVAPPRLSDCTYEDTQELVPDPVRCAAHIIFPPQGCLAVSRAFGDRTLQPYVIADPHVHSRPLDPEQDQFFYLASDGVTGA